MKESHHAVNAVRQDESTEDSEVASRIIALFSKKKSGCLSRFFVVPI